MIYLVHPKVFYHLGLKIRSHSLKEKYLNYRHHDVQVFITKKFLTSTFLSMEYWKLLPRLVILMILWWWHFLAMWGTTQKASRNCALFELCGKVGPPQPCKLWKQRCCCAAGRAPPLAAAISGASLTHQSFVNNRTRLLQREKVKAQFPLSYILDISHLDWC